MKKQFYIRYSLIGSDFFSCLLKLEIKGDTLRPSSILFHICGRGWVGVFISDEDRAHMTFFCRDIGFFKLAGEGVAPYHITVVKVWFKESFVQREKGRQRKDMSDFVE